MKTNISLNADDFCNAAEELFSENKNKEAVKCYLNSVLLKRLNPKAYKGLGIAYKNLKNFDKAIFYLEKAKKLSPFDFLIYRELGICYLAKGKFCNSTKNFIKAIKINPEDLNTQIQLAIAHEIMNEEEIALQIYQTIIEKHPEFKKAYIQKASLLMQKERYNEAGICFLNLLKVAPKYDRAYLGIGICCDKAGKPSIAKRYYKKYLKINPSSLNIEKVTNRIFALQNEKSINNNFLKIV